MEESTINFSWGKYSPHDNGGVIIAQKKDSPDGTSGFVFKNCEITWDGKTILGRAYRRYTRVIIANLVFGDMADPQG